jgi:hypothetical protein
MMSHQSLAKMRDVQVSGLASSATSRVLGLLIPCPLGAIGVEERQLRNAAVNEPTDKDWQDKWSDRSTVRNHVEAVDSGQILFAL